MIQAMENETVLTDIDEIKIKNENTEESCLFMAYFLDEEIAGKTVVECEELNKIYKNIFGKKIIGVVSALKGELTMDQDDREYTVDMLIQKEDKKLLLVTIAYPGDEIDWDDKNMKLKVFGKHKKTIIFDLF